MYNMQPPYPFLIKFWLKKGAYYTQDLTVLLIEMEIWTPFCIVSTLILKGIAGVLEAYKACIQRVTLYGPTNVAPIIYHVARFAEQAQKEEAEKGAHVCILSLGC